MKIFGYLLIGTFFAINCVGAAPKEEFIRKAGVYPLDDGGSTLTITKGAAGDCSIKTKWKSGDATESLLPDFPLRGDQWFVFIENPNQIWAFNGVDEALLLSHSEKESGTKFFPRAALRRCHQKFWEALPQALRDNYPKSGRGNREEAPRN